MGQDTSCGICGKHYQSCKHYTKEHLPDSDGKALCGRKNVVVLPDDWYERDIDPEDVCKHCAKLDMLFVTKFVETDDDEIIVWEYSE